MDLVADVFTQYIETRRPAGPYEGKMPDVGYMAWLKSKQERAVVSNAVRKELTQRLTPQARPVPEPKDDCELLIEYGCVRRSRLLVVVALVLWIIVVADFALLIEDHSHINDCPRPIATTGSLPLTSLAKSTLKVLMEGGVALSKANELQLEGLVLAVHIDVRRLVLIFRRAIDIKRDEFGEGQVVRLPEREHERWTAGGKGVGGGGMRGKRTSSYLTMRSSGIEIRTLSQFSDDAASWRTSSWV
jgi:hypothetical protein